jgi:pyruvate/2-oxoglutarate dehydrogenase complex dihydrolipoamide dehydrogenase (E3) component
MSESFDLVVIGGGTAGLSAVQAALGLGKRPLMVSEGPLGGECTWNGWVPSKALIEAARVHHTAIRAAAFGTRIDGLSVDFPGVMRRVHGVIDRIARFEDEKHLEHAGVAVRRARLSAPGVVPVGDDMVSTDRIVVATGSRPAIPPIPGLDSVPRLTNESLFALTSQPAHLLVLGAGPIGLEMAQSLVRLGSAVDVIDVARNFLPHEDPDVSVLARRLLEREACASPSGPRRPRYPMTAPPSRCTSEIAGAVRSLRGDALLVATGQRPNLDGLGLETIGVRVTKAGIDVDAHLQASVAGVYAAGDVTGMLPFTHAAAYQGRLAARNALGKRSGASYRVVPSVTFTDPEIAHVGITEPAARARHGGDVHVATLPFHGHRPRRHHRTDGWAHQGDHQGQTVVRHWGGGEVLGAHLIGPGAGELIHEFVLAMQVRAFSGRLAQAIHAYPAMSVGVQQAAAQLFPAGRATAGEMRDELSELES